MIPCVSHDMEPQTAFRPAERENSGVLARLEKRTLIWLAHHLPAWVHSDHLTALGFLALAGAGVSYWFARDSPAALVLVNLLLVVNWFGDSLDGTVARVRNRQRPRYGFYVDHVLDACGSVFLFMGLALSGYMSERIAVGLLVAYFLVSIEVYLATYTLGKFQLSQFAFGPTELRVLLIVGNFVLLTKPVVTLGGDQYLLFDVGGAAGIVGLTAALLWSTLKHGAHLYRAERLP